jgi:hypothetical protein
MKRTNEEIEQRHYLVLIERLAREGKSPWEVERAIKQLTEDDHRLAGALRRLLGSAGKKAA